MGRSQRSSAGQLDAWLCLALALAAGSIATALVASGIRLTVEDGFYYFKIAQHLALGHGSTFDGLHPTNGYHPLWLLCLVPVFLQPTSINAAIQNATLLQGLLLAGTSAGLYRLARTWLPRSASCLAAVLWTSLAYRLALSGLEFGLVSLLITVVALLLVSRFSGDAPRPAEYVVMGVLLALCFLARLDLVLFALLAGADLTRRMVARRREGPVATRVAALWIPVVVAAVGYLLINAALFGHPLPVSGLAKRLWSDHLLRQDPLYASGGWLAAKLGHVLRPLRHPSGASMAAIVLGGALPVALLALRAMGPQGQALTRWDLGMTTALRPLVLFAGLQPLAYAVVYHGYYSYAPWYFAVQTLLVALLAGALAAAWSRGVQRSDGAGAAVPIAACTLVVAAMAVSVTRLVGGATAREGPLYVAARWARDHLGPEARIGTWNAGAIGYLSGRQVVNLDGVANTAGYLLSEQYDLCAYWRRTGITYLVDVFEARAGSTAMQGTTLPVSRYYAACVQELELVWSERIPNNPGWPKAFRIRPAP